MRVISEQLIQYISDRFQIKTKEPRALVYFFHPETNEMMRLDKVVSINIDRRHDSQCVEWSIEADNTWGWVTYNYLYVKHPDTLQGIDRGDPQNNPWERVIWPNAKVEIHLGYGEEIHRQIVGLVDSVKINAKSKTIHIAGRCMYKKMMVQTPKDEHSYANTSVKDIVAEQVTLAGLDAEVNDILVTGTTTPYIVPLYEIKRGETYDEKISEVIRTTNSRLYCRHDGIIVLEPRPDPNQQQLEDHVLDEYINLTSAEYNTEDRDTWTNLVITDGTNIDAFHDGFLKDILCRGQFREQIIEVPWADTYEKRLMAARAIFREMKRSLYTITVGTIGNPALELYDLCRVSEHVTTASMKYYIKSIRTSFSHSSGYIELIELELA